MLHDNYTIILPENHTHTLEQDEEYCILKKNDGTGEHKVRFHDYGKIYSIPGLYEQLFYKKLKCISPDTVCSLLKKVVDESGEDLSDLRVLDLGAGNGMVGEALHNSGVEKIYGVDIEEKAKCAVERDRPGVYQNYYIKDFCSISDSFRLKIKGKALNCLTTVAALGFGDIPPKVFAEGFNLMATPAWVAFNIKEDFLSVDDSSGFSTLIRKIIDKGILQIRQQHHYRHRLSIQGDPLYYIALIGKKTADIPEDWFDAIMH